MGGVCTSPLSSSPSTTTLNDDDDIDKVMFSDPTILVPSPCPCGGPSPGPSPCPCAGPSPDPPAVGNDTIRIRAMTGVGAGKRRSICSMMSLHNVQSPRKGPIIRPS